ncbi:hypothetical protein BOTBODRAFT_45316 [Botryobasidium botryosum FD-172 SS1]|uniref:Uncharacterized protein n=1 Tax=Botryobasidium botryosum (strain FD-172 SS1) TaxID=930990 RepID=A0A067MCC7_BOTB1|nr:hypothetical protein BOTBODRAFT_45316 [Botryobasidium botryosum FD-172 SS1]
MLTCTLLVLGEQSPWAQWTANYEPSTTPLVGKFPQPISNRTTLPNYALWDPTIQGTFNQTAAKAFNRFMSENITGGTNGGNSGSGGNGPGTGNGTGTGTGQEGGSGSGNNGSGSTNNGSGGASNTGGSASASDTKNIAVTIGARCIADAAAVGSAAGLLLVSLLAFGLGRYLRRGPHSNQVALTNPEMTYQPHLSPAPLILNYQPTPTSPSSSAPVTRFSALSYASAPSVPGATPPIPSTTPSIPAANLFCREHEQDRWNKCTRGDSSAPLAQYPTVPPSHRPIFPSSHCAGPPTVSSQSWVAGLVPRAPQHAVKALCEPYVWADDVLPDILEGPECGSIQIQCCTILPPNRLDVSIWASCIEL